MKFTLFAASAALSSTQAIEYLQLSQDPASLEQLYTVPPFPSDPTVQNLLGLENMSAAMPKDLNSKLDKLTKISSSKPASKFEYSRFEHKSEIKDFFIGVGKAFKQKALENNIGNCISGLKTAKNAAMDAGA